MAFYLILKWEDHMQHQHTHIIHARIGPLTTIIVPLEHSPRHIIHHLYIGYPITSHSMSAPSRQNTNRYNKQHIAHRLIIIFMIWPPTHVDLHCKCAKIVSNPKSILCYDYECDSLFMWIHMIHYLRESWVNHSHLPYVPYIFIPPRGTLFCVLQYTFYCYLELARPLYLT